LALIFIPFEQVTNMPRILIDIQDRPWTLQAVHQACGEVRRTGGKITLLQLIPALHPRLLGVASGAWQLPETQYLDLQEYASTAEDYGVPIQLQPMYYITRKEALVQAAEMFDVDILFSRGSSIFKPWNAVQNSWLAHRLSKNKRHLVTLTPVLPAHLASK
jgi:hypothetical protein